MTRPQNDLVALRVTQTLSDNPISPECQAACDLAINLISHQPSDRSVARHIQQSPDIFDDDQLLNLLSKNDHFV
jgi:hypothetical protein